MAPGNAWRKLTLDSSDLRKAIYNRSAWPGYKAAEREPRILHNMEPPQTRHHVPGGRRHTRKIST